MHKKTTIKLSLSMLGILFLLLITAPELIAYGWQAIHGKEATLGNLSLKLEPGWIVIRGGAARLREDMLVRSSNETSIFAKPIGCQTDESAAAILLRLRAAIAKQHSALPTFASILIGGKHASCFIVVSEDSSDAVETSCISPSRQSLISIHSRLKDQAEAIHILQSAHETSNCPQQ
jgi:hypothetical protein